MGAQPEAGIARSRSKENNNQNAKGRSKAAKLDRLTFKGGGNPTKGGGINRSLKGKQG